MALPNYWMSCCFELVVMVLRDYLTVYSLIQFHQMRCCCLHYSYQESFCSFRFTSKIRLISLNSIWTYAYYVRVWETVLARYQNVQVLLFLFYFSIDSVFDDTGVGCEDTEDAYTKNYLFSTNRWVSERASERTSTFACAIHSRATLQSEHSIVTMSRHRQHTYEPTKNKISARNKTLISI